MKKLCVTCLLGVLVCCLFGIPAETKTGLTVANADLAISKSGPATANVNTDITYTITLTNNGPDPATNASWSDTLPPALLFNSLTQDTGPLMSCSTPDPGSGGTVSCSIASLSSGASAQFTLTVHIANNTPAGSTVSNTASATSSTPDANGSNNNFTTNMTVFSPASVTGTKSRSGGTAPGASLTYVITLSSSSGFDQQDNPGNEFTDVLPADLTLVGASASGGTPIANTGTNTVTWNGVIPADDSVTIVIDAIINMGTTGDTIANTGSINYDADGNGTNEASASTNTDSFTVGTAPLNADLGVTKSAPDNVPADSDVTYNITVGNSGPDTATSATLTDALPGTMTFVSLSQPAGWSCNSLTPGSGGTLTCSRDLPPGSGPQVFTLVGHVPSGTSNGTFYNNTATVSTTAIDSTSENNQATVGTTVLCATNGVVTTSADNGQGSLRKAILDACVGGTITFDMTPGHVTSPITLTSGELLINQNLTIQGPGANTLTISGNNADRVFRALGGTVLISDLTISNGLLVDNVGAGIVNGPAATLNLTNVTVSANTTIFGGAVGAGAGIFNNGTLTLTNSIVTGNSSIGGIGGPGGRGGGIYNAGTTNVTNSTISGNTSTTFGGGIYNAAGTLTVVNGTITNNRSDSDDAGAEQGGGLYRLGGTVTLKNTIVAGNFRGTGTARDDISGAVDATSSFNLIGDGTNMTGISDGSGGNQVGSAGSPINAMLGTLANNGGPTQTHLLLIGSPAINAGTNANLPADTLDLNGNSDTAEPLPVDQRGLGFPRVVNTTVDIGAVEANYAVSATAGTPQSAPINTAFGTALKATVTESGNPQNGVAVFFTPPASGPTGTFTGGNPATANTNASGIATAPAFTANGTAGSYNVVASLAGNLATANFALTNLKGNQTITVGTHAPASAAYNTSFTVAATASSGLLVSYSSAGVCTNIGATFTMTSGTGTCTVKYDQLGDSNYNPAPQVTESVNAFRANQTITFGPLAGKTFGDPDFTVSPTATSGLLVSLSPSGNCTVTSSSPGTVHLTGAGSCTLTASQAGNANYNPAADGQQTFSIAKAATIPAVSSSVNPSDFGQSVTFTATVSSGAGTPTGTVQFKDNGVNLGAPVTLNGSGQAQFTTSTLAVGARNITAAYSGDGNFLAGTGTLSGGQIVKAQPSLSINDVSTTEGQSGSKVMNFTVTLSPASSLTVTANYATANATATAGSDYVAIPSTLLTFNPGDTTKTVSVTINGDVSFEPDETFTVNLSNPTNATISKAAGTGTIQNDDAQGGFFSFSPATYSVNEAAGIVTVTVVRSNDVTQAATVDYATDDTGAATDCSVLNSGLAAQRCDYTSMFGTLKFAANETQKTVDIPINQDSYTEGPETFTVKLSNPTGGAALVSPSTATVTINDSAAPAPNAIDDTTTFVRQQYRDFLNRDADAAGLQFWKNNIDKCNDPAQRPPGQTLAACIEVQRITTSAAFFLSLEFRQTGGLVRDFYVATLPRPLTNNMPNFVEFMRDTQAIQKGVIVGQGNWQQILTANQQAFMNEFVMRPEFVGLYPTTDTPTIYVNKLYQHAAVPPANPGEQAAAIAEFGGAPTAADPGARARALLRVTQNPTFQARELPRAFVQMEYFGYLRRNPNDPPDNNFNGFDFWLNKLIQFNGDYLQAEMVKAFLGSTEYRKRFGP